jgi:hypothetical protein
MSENMRSLTFGSMSAEDWFGLARWGRTTAHLSAYDRKFSFAMGRLICQNVRASQNQERYGHAVLSKAQLNGWKPKWL